MNYLEAIKNKIITVDITDEMIQEAEREEAERMEKYGFGTREVRNKDGVIVRRDLIGSLAHQAVEIIFDRCRVIYKSTRTERYIGGDCTDIEYEQDSIDVKGTTRFLAKDWDYTNSFLVFQNQLDDPKMDNITHFCFVTIDPDFQMASIFGIISIGDFMRKSKPVKLQYDNKGISPAELQNLRNYIFRTHE